MQWRFAAGLSPEERAGLEVLIRDWEGLRSRPGAMVLKENRIRTVLRVPAPDRPPAAERWVVKVYRHLGFYDRLRARLFSSRAEREFRALRALRQRGFPVPRPLACGLRRRRGLTVEGGLVMEEIAGGLPLPALLSQTYGPDRSCDPANGAAPERLAEVRSLLIQLGALVRRLHESGVYHPDLHGGNLLLDSSGKASLHLIDLHSCRFPGFVPRFLRLKGLAMVAYSLRQALPVEELRWILSGYLDAAAAAREGAAHEDLAPTDLAPAAARLREEIALIIARLARRQLRSRTRRCLLNSTVFAVERWKGFRAFRRRAFPLEPVEPFLRVEPSGEVLKRSATGWVARVRACGREVILKHRRYGLLERLAGLFSTSRLRRAWIAALGLEVRSLPAPPGLALVERRRWGLVREAWLFQESIPGAAPLDRFLWETYGPAAPSAPGRCRGKLELARALGRLARRLHEAGVLKHDLAPQNLLVTPDSKLWIVDLDDVRFCDRLSGRRRERNLAQLGNLPEGHISTADFLRALKAYDGGAGKYYSGEAIARLRSRLLDESFHTIVRMTRDEHRSNGS
ncbi:MAG: hypothetical protein HY717_22780 [Planctomycetes bacterium]|nr:hypothetical protein [Planctomycetota bacterium]